MTRNRTTLRIVVADDHELVRRGIRDLLHVQHGWKVAGEAAGGRDAVESVRRLKPDIAIVDITMPDMDGLEATRRIQEASANTKVLILTMHESDQMVRRVLEAGARGYVLKSDMAVHLVQAVKDLAKGKLSLTPKVSEIILKGFLRRGVDAKQQEHAQAKLSPREREIVRLLACGKGNKEIAAELGITLRTVETHRRRIMMKMGFHSLTDLIHYAIRDKIVAVQDL
ncbi:MAG TPA: response regulator transcription factor [Candidatus Acidoferrum sp.]